jgi:hypothetical protein
MIRLSQTGMNIPSWLLASLIFDSIRPLKTKLYTDEKSNSDFFIDPNLQPYYF